MLCRADGDQDCKNQRITSVVHTSTIPSRDGDRQRSALPHPAYACGGPRRCGRGAAAVRCWTGQSDCVAARGSAIADGDDSVRVPSGQYTYVSRGVGQRRGDCQGARAGGTGGQAIDAIREEIRGSPCVHGDETGWREDGVNGYVGTFYRIGAQSPSIGADAYPPAWLKGQSLRG